VNHAQQVGQEARAAEPHQHQRDRELLRGVRVASRRSRQRDADDADRDREHGGVLVAPGVLPEHALAEEHQHQQAGRERGLHEHERGQQERHDLQREAEHREPGAEQPAPAPDQPARQLESQVGLVRRLLGVHRLQHDP
jgi:hypothetical protein